METKEKRILNCEKDFRIIENGNIVQDVLQYEITDMTYERFNCTGLSKIEQSRLVYQQHKQMDDIFH